MKQSISEEQWEELSYDGKSALIAFLYPTTVCEVPPTTKTVIELYLDEYFKDYGVNIGQMIEFLGNRWISEFGVAVEKGGRVCGVVNMCINDDLCDSLWEAVKHKLNQT